MGRVAKMAAHYISAIGPPPPLQPMKDIPL